ncbi:uncharacterized protein K452DRAFT_319492 [Aplosporella prunicola CBS 121167]|uniref:SET domain-containing protein n=1 Tax=Aplosporella prunicola CBS 121167 TaxID=1176127 RepID=A0A6A6BBD9_9PEZI|nr:uncharacterized protein K452DRAFT_319492 [Aplosporella prunicola CBS 121167]KAF2140574.1 hypothetical protein K452DRAFT_319492 [Aplosporella prunicola CBS 121167]
MATTRSFEIKQTPKTGTGIIATAPIPSGTLIHAEAPAITIPYPQESWLKRSLAIMGAAQRLPAETQEQFFALNVNAATRAACKNLFGKLLAQAESKDPALWQELQALEPDEREAAAQCFVSANVVFAGNSKPLGALGQGHWAGAENDRVGDEWGDRGDADALFLTAARFNHSCVANAHLSWNPATRRLHVLAKTDIAAGDEVYVSYRGQALSVLGCDQRQLVLVKKYGFLCLCAECCKKGPELKRSDLVRKVAKSLLERYGGVPETGVERRAAIESLGKAEKELWNVDVMSVAHVKMNLSKLYVAEGDVEKAQECCLEACRIFKTCLGKDNPVTVSVVKSLLACRRGPFIRELLVASLGYTEEELGMDEVGDEVGEVDDEAV